MNTLFFTGNQRNNDDNNNNDNDNDDDNSTTLTHWKHKEMCYDYKSRHNIYSYFES